MDLVDRRLRQLEADYAATVAAGTRVTPVRPSEERTDERTNNAIETPVLEDELLPVQIEGVKYEPRRECVEPLSDEQIHQIKQHMQSIKLAHNPEWASELSDEQFARVFTNVYSRDNSG